jgi:SAM-dependent methyltransferase
MSATNELANETRRADVNLHRFIADDHWRRIHDDSARDYKSGEWVREKIFGVGRKRRELFSLATGNVLDVGCGYGSNFEYLTNAADITGVDVSPVMLDMAREHARQLNLTVDLRQGDVSISTFPIKRSTRSSLRWRPARTLTRSRHCARCSASANPTGDYCCSNMAAVAGD